ncbi:MAG: thiamine pyrophosphate-dependent enzyme [Candidatus Poseidoniia archaeon]|nr:2-oxoacid:ferredoxin oxidoreductase subunit beta [Euryarchaeota archaeon]MDP6489636.1 thiamine pyrophosphate-dependent enzyme [Candidatus Poseidoniia archaeon]MDP6533790.1 thiamine pyrophosphate-dependent enzyme [Candidatus Poseidoniia archaeon]MDP6834760.1 thiamine pyrophosphate-dependent enzyme [Candidatus Poseidoniia archaeon]MDP7007635.1 thiamine pyrophosphate-dependent enzyme [Candidatus Poseidoniia archaeon]
MDTSPNQLAHALETHHHPVDEVLRKERIPHIWCPGCGLGPVTSAFTRALEQADTPPSKQVVVSGIGCSGRTAGYVNIDSYHTTHGRAVAFATGLKLAKPELGVTVFSGDGDLFSIGGNHIIHAARRNLDLTILCNNNFIYGMTGGQMAATTPHEARSTTSPLGNFEYPFNLPQIMSALGATMVSRWTSLHVRQLTDAMVSALNHDGLAFVEIVSPCPSGYGKRNEFVDGLSHMRHFREYAHVDHDADLSTIDLDFASDKPVVLGNFVKLDKPSYLVVKNRMLEEQGIDRQTSSRLRESA